MLRIDRLGFMSSITTRACLAAALAVSLLSAAGCGGGGVKGKGEGVVIRSPQWRFERYERIAVAPVQASDPRGSGAAKQVTVLLEDLLTRNGQFSMLSRDALKEVLTEQDLSRLAEVADPSTVIPAGRIKSAQAIIVGVITDCSLDAERVDKKKDIYSKMDPALIARRDPRGFPHVIGTEVVPEYRHYARIAGTVRIIDTATGEQVYSYSVPPIEAEAKQERTPPKDSPQELAVQASRKMADEFYKAIAPIRIKIKLKKEMLVVALDYYDGRYETIDTLSTTQKKFLVGVRQLPPECDRNRFKVAVAPLQGRNIWEEEFVWSGENPVRGQAFEVPVDKLIDAGVTEFQAKFYTIGDDEPLITYKFKLEAPKAQQ